jgi:signal transduction histidine kinase
MSASPAATHSSSPATNAALVSTGIAAAVLSYALGESARLPGSLAGLAVLTVRYERDRMARELHDVIGHSVSIMVIQASAGQRLTASDAGAADEMLGNIAGLAERAAAVGGTFASGPAPAGGWRLSAALPG